MAIRLLSIVLLVLFASTASAQQIYRWKDKKGQWHFSNTAPPGVTAEKVRGLDISPKGMVLPDEEPSSGEAVGTRQEEEKVASPGPTGENELKEKKEEPVDVKMKALTPEEQRAEKRAKEEKEYQKRVREITGRIKALMDRYSLATGRGAGPEPRLLNSEEAIKGRTADLMSRLRDRQYNPAGPSRVELFTGGSKTRELRRGVARPRVRVPLPAYSAKEKELSNLRAQINQLRAERERLIQEMKRKKFDTGSLFLE